MNVERKIVLRVVGGLGNQLFSYAAARRLARINDAELVLDHVSGFSRNDQYRRHYQLDHFRIPCRTATAADRLEPFSCLRRYFKRSANQFRPYEDRQYIRQDGDDFDARMLCRGVRGTLYLEGYWQSEGYFKDVGESIRAELQIRPPTDPANLALATRIRDCPSVAVHVRYFDVEDVDQSSNVPGAYYDRAVKMMETLVPGAHYFVFSDRPEDACDCIPLPQDRMTCVSLNRGDANAYADLWLMTQCRHAIIANSTFSWWGAWLQGAPAKIIMAPDIVRSGKAAWGFSGLIPEGWRQIAAS